MAEGSGSIEWHGASETPEQRALSLLGRGLMFALGDF